MVLASIPSRISDQGPNEVPAEVASHWNDRALERYLEDGDLGRALATWFDYGYSDAEVIDLLKIARIRAKQWAGDQASDVNNDDGPEAA